MHDRKDIERSQHFDEADGIAPQYRSERDHEWEDNAADDCDQNTVGDSDDKD